MIRFEKHANEHILDIPELNEYRKQEHKFARNKNYYNKKKLLDKVNLFFKWYLNYCKSHLKGKMYNQDNIAQVVLKLHLKNQKHWNEYLCNSLFLSQEYVQYLQNVINIKNLRAFEHTLNGLTIDLEWLISEYEINVKRTVESISLNSGRRRNLSPIDLLSAVRTLFHIEEYSKMEDLYLRDLKPLVMFQIRQLVEVFGRELIGYYSINDKDGLPVKKFTQISWDFIKEEVKKECSRIKLPFNVQTVIDINKWSNNFVHTTYIHNSYIQYFVLNTIQILFNSKTKGITIYTGKISRRMDISDIQITNYNSLKNDFEIYLKNKTPNIVVQWMPTSKVGAYIISE